MAQYSVEPMGQPTQMRTLTDWLGEARELTDRIENHLTNMGALPVVLPAKVEAEDGSIFTTVEGLVTRLQAIEGALSRTAFALGGKLGGQR